MSKQVAPMGSFQVDDIPDETVHKIVEKANIDYVEFDDEEDQPMTYMRAARLVLSPKVSYAAASTTSQETVVTTGATNKSTNEGSKKERRRR